MKYKINCHITTKQFTEVCDNWLSYELSQLRRRYVYKLRTLGCKMHMTNVPQYITLAMAMLEEKIGKNNIRTMTLADFRREYLSNINNIYVTYYNCIAHKELPRIVRPGIIRDSDQNGYVRRNWHYRDYLYYVELYEESTRRFTHTQAAAIAFVEAKNMLSRFNKPLKIGNRNFAVRNMFEAVQEDNFVDFDTYFNRYYWVDLSKIIASKLPKRIVR